MINATHIVTRCIRNGYIPKTVMYEKTVMHEKTVMYENFDAVLTLFPPSCVLTGCVRDRYPALLTTDGDPH